MAATCIPEWERKRIPLGKLTQLGGIDKFLFWVETLPQQIKVQSCERTLLRTISSLHIYVHTCVSCTQIYLHTLNSYIHASNTKKFRNKSIKCLNFHLLFFLPDSSSSSPREARTLPFTSIM